jgi:hypothetical protein
MRHRWLLSLLLVSASGVIQAQTVSPDSALSRNIQKDVDSVSLNPRLNQRSKRALLRIDARADTIRFNKADTVRVVKTDTLIKHDTTIVTKVDTVYVVKPDTIVPPDTVKPPKPDTLPIIFVHPYAPQPNGAAYAELPRDTVSTVVPLPTRTIPVVSLQAALDTAKTGDLLKIPSNHITSHLHVRPTSRTSWVTIQGTDSTSIIQTTIGGSESAVNIESGAHHVRFLGPLLMRAQTDATNAIFRSFNGETQVGQLAHHIIVDGVTMDGGIYTVRRCAWPDGAYMAIVNSRLLQCASRSGDAQAIIIGNGTGPYRFENNYLEGGHQCFMSGGFDESLPVGNLPSDIVFRNNICFKPYKWHYVGTPPNQTYPGESRQIKTIIETKYIRRALFEHNTLRNVYGDAQAGFCGLFKSTNQNGGMLWAQTLDVTFRYNRCVTMANGLNLAAHPQGGISMTRLSAYDNRFDSLSTGGGEGINVQLLDDLVDMILIHNTFSNTGNAAVMFDGAPTSKTVINANIMPNGIYGVKGNATPSGNATITKFMPGGLFQSNIMPGASCSTLPATNICTMPNPIPIAPDGKPIGADSTKVPLN